MASGYSIEALMPYSERRPASHAFGEMDDFINVLQLLLRCVRERLGDTGTTTARPQTTRVTKFGPPADKKRGYSLMSPSGVGASSDTAGIATSAFHTRPVAAKPLGSGPSGGVDLEYLRSRAAVEQTERTYCENLLQVLSFEMTNEMKRQLKLLQIESTSSEAVIRRRLRGTGTSAHDPSSAAASAGVVIPNLRSQAYLPMKDTELPRLQFEAAKERAEAADGLMRLLEEFRFVSIADTVGYLQSTLEKTMPALAKVAASANRESQLRKMRSRGASILPPITSPTSRQSSLLEGSAFSPV